MHAAIAYLEHLLFTALVAAAVIVTVFVMAVRALARLSCRPRVYGRGSAQEDAPPRPEPAAPQADASVRPPWLPRDGGNG